MPSRPWPRIVRGPDDRHVEPGGGGRRHAHSAASLAWPYASCGWGTVVGSTGFDSGTPNTALDDVCTTLATPASAHASSRVARAVDVDRAQQLAVLGERHLGDVVEHDVDAVDGAADRVADRGCRRATNSTPPAARVGDVDVEEPDGVAALDEAVGRAATEVAVAAGDEAGRGHSSSPCSRHQRMLRRIPSSSATSGRSRARHGRRRCRRRWSCPSRRARGAAARSGRCAGAAPSARSASAAGDRRQAQPVGLDVEALGGEARPTVATISVTSYGRSSAIHHAGPAGRPVSSARTTPWTRLST